MDRLTFRQLPVILELFFKPHNEDSFAGWKNIATKLLTKGVVIIPKQGEPLWSGGVGNFMKYTDHPDGEDISVVTFYLGNFLESNLLKDRLSLWLEKEYDDHVEKELVLKSLTKLT